MELERLQATQALSLRPEDFLVVKANCKLSLEERAELHARFEQMTGHARILILDAGADIAVLRPELEPEPQPARLEPQLPPKRGSAPGAIA